MSHVLGGSSGAVPSSSAGRLGHHASDLLKVVIVGVVLVRLFPLPGALALTVPVALFTAAIALFFAMRAHNRRLCHSCVTSLPLDPAGRARRQQLRLLVCHRLSEPKLAVPYLLLLAGTNLLTSGIGLWVWAAAQLTMIYLLLAVDSHRMLQPWCTYCNGKGGTEVDDVAPVLPHDDRQNA